MTKKVPHRRAALFLHFAAHRGFSGCLPAQPVKRGFAGGAWNARLGSRSSNGERQVEEKKQRGARAVAASQTCAQSSISVVAMATPPARRLLDVFCLS